MTTYSLNQFHKMNKSTFTVKTTYSDGSSDTQVCNGVGEVIDITNLYKDSVDEDTLFRVLLLNKQKVFTKLYLNNNGDVNIQLDIEIL